jgi:hypothetical protein
MGIENHDIKTVNKLIGSAIVDLGLGAVPSGMKRYVTFLRLDNVHGGKQKVYLASTTATTYASTPTLASAAALLTVNIEADEEECIPPGVPATEHPLFSVAAGKYIDALTDRGGAYMFLQYYDK